MYSTKPQRNQRKILQSSSSNHQKLIAHTCSIERLYWNNDHKQCNLCPKSMHHSRTYGIWKQKSPKRNSFEFAQMLHRTKIWQFWFICLVSFVKNWKNTNKLNIYFYSSIISTLLLITLISTLLDMCSKNFLKRTNKVFTIFSLAHNFSNLMKTSNSKSQIRCIDGMKIFAAFYIIIGHRMEFTFRIKALGGWQNSIKEFITGYKFGLDVFFVCSGVLITMSLLRNLQA